MDFSSCLLEVKQMLHLPNDFVYKDKQLECLEAVFRDQDIVAVLPTGYGKSLIFQSVPFLLEARNGPFKQTKNIVIVITPLNSIMMDQCRQLCEQGVNACYLDYKAESAYAVLPHDSDSDSDSEKGTMESMVPLSEIEQGCFNILYAHPESLLCTSGRKLIKKIRPLVCAVSIDEAHIVLEW